MFYLINIFLKYFFNMIKIYIITYFCLFNYEFNFINFYLSIVKKLGLSKIKNYIIFEIYIIISKQFK